MLYLSQDSHKKLYTFMLQRYGVLSVLSRLTVGGHETKKEVPCDGLWTNTHEHFTRTNVKNKKCHNLRSFKAYALQLQIINILSR